MKLRVRRVWWALGAGVVALGLVGGTWLLTSRFQSPAQRDAAASALESGPVVVEVVRGDLVEQISALASAKREGTRQVSIPIGGEASVVTGEGAGLGKELHSGAVVTWINGRPLLALRGAFPLYRDIGQGDSGDDVRLLQQALADLGYDVTPDGSFGAYTAWCIQDLYASVGSAALTRESVVLAEESSKSASVPTGEVRDSDKKLAPDPAATKASGKEVLVRASEVLMLKDLPAHVVTAPEVGTVLDAENAKLGLAGSGVVLQSEVPGSVAAQLNEGAIGIATVGDKSIEVKIRGMEDNKPDSPGEGAQDTSVVTFVPQVGLVPEEWAGKDDVLVTLNLSEPLMDVLQVPERALAAGADGRITVLVQQADGSFKQMQVTELGCISGTCAIEGGAVDGDAVRVDR